MNKFRFLLSLIAIVALSFTAPAAKTLSAAKVAKLKGEVAHPFSSIRQSTSFGAKGLGKASLAAPLAASTDPAVTINDAGGWGTLEGPDGTTWFYSQTYTTNPTNKWYYGGSVITIYDDLNQKVWDFEITIPDDQLVNQIAPFGKITRSFFERNTSSYEVMVYVHRILSPGVATSDIDVYSSDGSKVISYPDAQSAKMISEGASAYSKQERLALAYYETVTEGENVQENMRFDILRKGTYSEGPNPVVDHSFTIDYNTIHYSDGTSFDARFIDGKFYYILSHYEKPYVESYDWMTGDMVYSEDNNYIVEVYDQTYKKIGGITAPVEMGSAMPTMYAFNVFSDNDISFGYYSGDGKLNLVLTSYDYVVSSDSYTYFIDVYDGDGNIIKPVTSKVDDWISLGAIPGQEDQMAFLKTTEEGNQYFEMLDVPSCTVAATIPAQLNGKRISNNFDRVASNGSYKYAISIGEAEGDAEGNVIALIGWYNKDLSFDRYTRFNLGPNGELFTPILLTEYLNPYIFDTDDDLEYIYIAKIKRTDGSGKVDNVLCIANEDGSLIREFKGNAEIGDYANGSLLNLNTSHPSIFIAYQNTSASTFKLDFFNLPFTMFAGGEGTKENPYLVSGIGDLMQVQNNQKAYFKQIADIDLSSVSTWTPVDLQGGYDGGSHSIFNANIASDKGSLGIFGTVTGVDGTNPAYIKNLTVVNPTVTGGDDNDAIAGLAGNIVATVVDNAHVINPSFEWNATYASTIGGLVGSASFQSTISNCSVEGMNSVSDKAYQTGGILGSLGNSTHVSNCVASIKATGRNTIGGIAGAAGGVSADGSITNCHAYVDLTAENTLGGIAGSSSRIRIANCYATGTLTATRPEYGDYSEPFYSVGGIIGNLATDWNGSSNIVLENCVAALSSISVDDPNNTDGKYLALDRVVGSTVDVLGMSGYSEKGIKNCYANSAMTINGVATSATDDTKAAGADKALADMDKAFFESLGFAYGDNADAPWTAEGVLPILFFESAPKAAAFEADKITVDDVELTFTNTLQIFGGTFFDVEASSSDESVATIGGLTLDYDNFTATVSVISKGVGTATVTAVVDDIFTVSFIVEVTGNSAVDDAISAKAAIMVKDNVVIAPEAEKIEVYNISGARVAQAQQSSLSVAELSNGIYVAVATDAAGHRSTVKFVKK